MKLSEMDRDFVEKVNEFRKFIDYKVVSRQAEQAAFEDLDRIQYLVGLHLRRARPHPNFDKMKLVWSDEWATVNEDYEGTSDASSVSVYSDAKDHWIVVRCNGGQACFRTLSAPALPKRIPRGYRTGPANAEFYWCRDVAADVFKTGVDDNTFCENDG